MTIKNKTIAISKELGLSLSKAKLEYGFDSFESLIKGLLMSYVKQVNQEK